MFFLLVSTIALCVNGQELLNLRFSESGDIDSPTRIKKIVKIDDLPGFHSALYLQTAKRNNKLSSTHWDRKFDPINADKFIVDYWIKPVDKYSLYGLFVRDGRRQMVAVLFRDKRIVCNDGGIWQQGPLYEIGKWQQIRYVINCMTQKYDVFFNDMQVPIAKGYEFRHYDTHVPNNIWIASSEEHESTTLLADIKIIGEKNTFPSKEFEQAPFHILGVNKIDNPLVIDGLGSDPDWENASALKLTRTDKESVNEKSTVKLLWDDQNLYLLFEGEAKEARMRKSRHKDNDVKELFTDCFEFFIDPQKSRENYYHFVGNALGSRYDAKHNSKKNNKDFNSSWQVKTVIANNKWSAEVLIPFETLQKAPKPGDIWGFNVKRKNLYKQEITSWTPLDNFHLPERFGTLFFTDKEHLIRQPSNIDKILAEEIYSIVNNVAKQLVQIKKIMGENLYFNRRYKQSDFFLDSIKNKTNNAEDLITYSKQLREAKQLLKDTYLLQVESNRHQTLFIPGSDGDKNGYIVSPENSMNRVYQDSYVGNLQDSFSLCLAGNEYGSFQAVVSTKNTSINKINISVSDLKSKNGETILSSQIKSFKVGYVKTALSSPKQKNIPDVLWEGQSFKYPMGETLKTIWFDIYIPSDTEAGIYHGTVEIKPNNKKATYLKVTIKVYDFSLPKTASLKNIFCFMPHWAESYYGKKMPQEKRLAYFDFIIDHRLEPVNLWAGGNMFMSEDELKYSFKRGKDLIMLPISRDENGYREKVDSYLDILYRNDWMDKAVFFGHDEVILFTEGLAQMKKMYKLTKELAPEIPRLNTTHIVPELYGYVDIWCPLFTRYNEKDAQARMNKDEKVWWYPTDYPLAPYANFNLDSPIIDARIIPWMNWKLNLSGLLYWSINREWITNGGQQTIISEDVIKLREIEWLTPEIKQKIKDGLRWPEIPWIPVFNNMNTEKTSFTNGGGNLMYPGPDWEPLPSIRLKNLRDGLQDYEYFILLKNNLTMLKEQSENSQLIKEIETALSLDENVVQSATSYTKDGKNLLKAKKYIADLITRSNYELRK